MTEKQAKSVFAHELSRFAAIYPVVKGTRLVFRARHYLKHPEARDLAWHEADARTVYLLRSALTRSPACLRGIFRHELGHACDPDFGPGGEARADRIARRVLGVPVRYTRDGVQHATHGAPTRPSWLPR
ncbi:MAG: hypothetical protein ABIO70_14535 [Pseudomonadota bacterium]